MLLRAHTLPNAITVGRILLAPAVLFLVFQPGFGARLFAFVLFLVAAFSDLWDGYLARKHGWISDFGKIMDPLADKLLLVATLLPIYIVSNRGGPLGVIPVIGALPLWVLVVVFGREALVTAVRAVAARRGIVIPAGRLGKNKALAQNIFSGAVLFWFALASAALQYGWDGPFWNGWVVFHGIFVLVSLAIAILLTVVSLIAYLWQWRLLVRAT